MKKLLLFVVVATLLSSCVSSKQYICEAYESDIRKHQISNRY